MHLALGIWKQRFFQPTLQKAKRAPKMTAHESSCQSNNSSSSENSLHFRSSPLPAPDDNGRQPSPRIQWGLVFLAVLIVFLLPQLQLSTVASKIFSATPVAMSPTDKPTSSDDPARDGKMRVFLIKLHSQVELTKRPNVSCDSQRSQPIVVRVPICR